MKVHRRGMEVAREVPQRAKSQNLSLRSAQGPWLSPSLSNLELNLADVTRHQSHPLLRNRSLHKALHQATHLPNIWAIKGRLTPKTKRTYNNIQRNYHLIQRLRASKDCRRPWNPSSPRQLARRWAPYRLSKICSNQCQTPLTSKKSN